MRARSLLWPAASAILLALALPGRAHAHLVQTGFGGFYDGLAHLFVTPSDLLVVIALALLAGTSGRPATRQLLLVLPLAWLVGGWLGPLGSTGEPPALLAPLLFGIAGVLVAAARPLSPAVVALLGGVGGLLQGWGNGLSLQPGQAAGLPLWGVVAAIFVMTTLLGARVVSLSAEWAKIVVRVAGSWIAAIGLLMVGWLSR